MIIVYVLHATDLLRLKVVAYRRDHSNPSWLAVRMQ